MIFIIYLPCWLFARVLVVGLLAAKTAAAAEAAGTVGNGTDVEGIEFKRELPWGG